MSDLSSYREQETLEAVESGGVYVSLHTADEGNQPDGSNEVSASDYDRAFVPAGDLEITGEGPTTLSNTQPVEFGITESNWGTITHGALWDAATDGNPETSTVELGESGEVPDGISVTVPTGGITFQLD